MAKIKLTQKVEDFKKSIISRIITMESLAGMYKKEKKYSKEHFYRGKTQAFESSLCCMFNLSFIQVWDLVIAEKQRRLREEN